MAKPLTAQKIFRSVYTVVERRMGMVPDDLTPSSNISQWFDGDPGERQNFVRDLEERIGIDIDDSAVAQSETFQDLCDWCARRSAALAEDRHSRDDEDDEDEYIRGHRHRMMMKKVVMPIFLALVVAGLAVAAIWWRKGCPKFW